MPEGLGTSARLPSALHRARLCLDGRERSGGAIHLGARAARQETPHEGRFLYVQALTVRLPAAESVR